MWSVLEGTPREYHQHVSQRTSRTWPVGERRHVNTVRRVHGGVGGVAFEAQQHIHLVLVVVVVRCFGLFGARGNAHPMATANGQGFTGGDFPFPRASNTFARQARILDVALKINHIGKKR
jgi:hypothetical protein